MHQWNLLVVIIKMGLDTTTSRCVVYKMNNKNHYHKTLSGEHPHIHEEMPWLNVLFLRT